MLRSTEIVMSINSHLKTRPAKRSYKFWYKTGTTDKTYRAQNALFVNIITQAPSKDFKRTWSKLDFVEYRSK